MIAFKCAITGDTQPKTAAYPIEANATVYQGQVVALDISGHEGYVYPVGATGQPPCLAWRRNTHGLLHDLPSRHKRRNSGLGQPSAGLCDRRTGNNGDRRLGYHDN